MKKRYIPVAAAIVIVSVILVFLFRQTLCENPTRPCADGRERHQRKTFSHPSIVSLSPAFTETVYMLGGGSNLIAVTDSCVYPSEAAGIYSIGPAEAPDIGKITSLKPDCVIAAKGQEALCEKLGKAGIRTLVCGSSSIDAICSAVWDIAGLLDSYDRAGAWISDLDITLQVINAKRRKTAFVPRVLVCVGRENKPVEKGFFSGQGLFYSDIISAAGGTNAYTGKLLCPELSAEEINRIDPDIILDIIPAGAGRKPDTDKSEFLQQWNSLKKRRNGTIRKIQIVSGSWAGIPGPRIIKILDTFSAEILGVGLSGK